MINTIIRVGKFIKTISRSIGKGIYNGICIIGMLAGIVAATCGVLSIIGATILYYIPMSEEHLAKPDNNVFMDAIGMGFGVVFLLGILYGVFLILKEMVIFIIHIWKDTKDAWEDACDEVEEEKLR